MKIVLGLEGDLLSRDLESGREFSCFVKGKNSNLNIRDR